MVDNWRDFMSLGPSDPSSTLSLSPSIRTVSLFVVLLAIFAHPSSAVLQGSPKVLEHFPDDFYKIEGTPEIEASMERSSVYQGDDTSIYLTLINRGSVISIKVNEVPAEKAAYEVYAAELEL
jgi:hypothetical protein